AALPRPPAAPDGPLPGGRAGPGDAAEPGRHHVDAPQDDAVLDRAARRPL
ncbi:MAG: hypothetical protein AVDCRST_MAG79-2184, partial [uncultured Thermoleophilia bacterium]